MENTTQQREHRKHKREALCTLPLPPEGKIITDGEKIQCHVCGYWCKALAPSHISIHNLTAEDYREIYGLNKTQPLAGEAFLDWCSNHIREVGINGKFGSILKMQKAAVLSRHEPHRLQANIANSKARIGIPLPNTPARRKAQKLNYQKALIPLHCEICGVEILRHKSLKHVYCPTCKIIHVKEYGKTYNDDHKEQLRQYWHEYDLKRIRRTKIEGGDLCQGVNAG